MIHRIAAGILVAGLAMSAIVPTVALAATKVYKTEKTCVAHKMLWKDGACHKA